MLKVKGGIAPQLTTTFVHVVLKNNLTEKYAEAVLSSSEGKQTASARAEQARGIG